jgi:ribonuclease-3
MTEHTSAPSLGKLCRKLGVAFTDQGLLQQALIHTSYANERKGDSSQHNERLEFLGDAVLDLVISEYLYRRFGDLPEGELTKARATVVCEPALAGRAKAIGLGEHLLLGRGEAASGGRERISILADAFEAVIGAVYLDRGLAAAADFVLTQLADELARVAKGNYPQDYKTLLQEVVQRNSDSKLIYEVVDERGPDHSKVFVVAVYVGGNKLGEGSGRSKKEAEQKAACKALAVMIGPEE